MLRRIVAMGLILGWAAWALSGCGNNSSTAAPKAPSNGTLITLIGDFPVCDVLTLRPTVTQISAASKVGAIGVDLLNTATQLIKFNVANLRDSETFLDINSLPVGGYSAVTLTLSSPALIVFDPTQSPPIRAVTVNLTTTRAAVPIQPPLIIPAPVNGQAQVAVLRLDFDLSQSIGVDSVGQVTGSINPTLHATALAASGSQGFGELDSVRGFVLRVDTAAGNPSLTGDVQLQLLEGNGPSLVVNINTATQVLGATALNQVGTGSFVVADGFIDANGNFVAKNLEIQDREDLSVNKAAFVGVVASVTKDSSGNVTQFNFYVHEQAPNAFPSLVIQEDSVATVNVSSSTGYQVSSNFANFPNLAFSPAAIVPGQELFVHGTATASPAAIAADQIFLKLQTLQGNFSSLVQAGSDDKTGAFNFSPCATLLRGTPVLVVTGSQTAFVNVGGLGQLTPQSTLFVRGLAFFEPRATTVNGVAVPARTLVVVAKEVHQLS